MFRPANRRRSTRTYPQPLREAPCCSAHREGEIGSPELPRRAALSLLTGYFWGTGFANAEQVLSVDGLEDPSPGLRMGPVENKDQELEFGRLRSMKSEYETVLSIVNQSTGATLSAWWVNYDGDEEWFGDIPPGDSWVVSTWVTHPWRIRNQEGKLVRQVIVNDAKEAIVVIDDQDVPLNDEEMQESDMEFSGFDGLGNSEDKFLEAVVETVGATIYGPAVLL